MDIQLLENQSWRLVCRINRVIDMYGARHDRLFNLGRRAYARFQRRQDKLFNYYPDGFAPSSVKPSGDVGQGTSSIDCVNDLCLVQCPLCGTSNFSGVLVY